MRGGSLVVEWWSSNVERTAGQSYRGLSCKNGLLEACSGRGQTITRGLGGAKDWDALVWLSSREALQILVFLPSLPSTSSVRRQ